MFCKKYHFNPETLRFEQVKLNSKQKFRLFLSLTCGVVLLATGLRAGFEKHFSTPKEIIYSKENLQLREAYTALNNKLYIVENQLSELKNRDDRLYRSILELDPVPSSIREGGTGGAPRYIDIRNITDPELILDIFRKMDKISTRVQIQSSSLEDLYSRALETEKLLACKPSIQPISPADHFWMTSAYGYRLDPFTKKRCWHLGIDLAGPYGLHIHATGDGVVQTAAYNRHGYGKEVVIDHGFGYTTRYAHLKEMYVKPGEKVYRGQTIGELGSTGRSTGPHLHYEVHYMNRTVNPMLYFYENLTSSEYSELALHASEKVGTVHSYALSKK
ncbi:MAG: M23 family metallopeptidase [Bacteroidales bacterium]|nr:M23 family metallopeptidase [Bacteroidales bacterium]